jgi:hypothetical protein
MEDDDAAAVPEKFMESSISRGLQVLSSHTIHHFALIAMTLRAHGIEMDPEFGTAPSTLRVLSTKAATPVPVEVRNVICTVRGAHQAAGYHLLRNRDEKRTRAAGLGPRMEEREA